MEDRQGIDEKMVLELIENSFFYNTLHKSKHVSSKDDKNLQDYIEKTYGPLSNLCSKLRFHDIQKVEGWREKSDAILREEVGKEKESGFGSERGYLTFTHDKLVEKYIKRVLLDVWVDSLPHTII